MTSRLSVPATALAMVLPLLAVTRGSPLPTKLNIFENPVTIRESGTSYSSRLPFNTFSVPSGSGSWQRSWSLAGGEQPTGVFSGIAPSRRVVPVPYSPPARGKLTNAERTLVQWLIRNILLGLSRKQVRTNRPAGSSATAYPTWLLNPLSSSASRPATSTASPSTTTQATQSSNSNNLSELLRKIMQQTAGSSARTERPKTVSSWSFSLGGHSDNTDTPHLSSDFWPFKLGSPKYEFKQYKVGPVTESAVTIPRARAGLQTHTETDQLYQEMPVPKTQTLFRSASPSGEVVRGHPLVLRTSAEMK